MCLGCSRQGGQANLACFGLEGVMGGPSSLGGEHEICWLLLVCSIICAAHLRNLGGHLQVGHLVSLLPTGGSNHSPTNADNTGSCHQDELRYRLCRKKIKEKNRNIQHQISRAKTISIGNLRPPPPMLWEPSQSGWPPNPRVG